MRFHYLEIKNINSLYGTQKIDFEQNLSDPLFLIMGPTGAGKTTLLDGICLALFATTPRQREVRKGEDVAEAVLSRGTGEGEVTVHFSREDRDRGGRVTYEAKWYCRRAHGRPDGKMQKPTRSLDRIDPDGSRHEIITNSEKIAENDQAFKEALQGMTLDDFLRSLLLAQGEFTAFLEAGEDQKAQILERLTDTFEYQEIGARGAERFKEVKDKKKELDLQIGEDKICSDEEYAVLQARVEKANGEEKVLREKNERAQIRLQWAREWERLGRVSKTAAEALAVFLEGEKQEFDPKRQRLERGKRAQKPGRHLKNWRVVQEERVTNEGRLKSLRTGLEELAGKKTALAPQRGAKKAALAEARALLEKKSEEIKAARSLDQSLEEAKKAERDLKNQWEERKKKKEELEKALDAARFAEEKTTTGAEEAEKAYNNKEPFAGLLEAISGLEARKQNLKDQEETLTKKKRHKESLQKELDRQKEQEARLLQALEGTRKKVDLLAERLDERGVEPDAEAQEKLRHLGSTLLSSLETLGFLQKERQQLIASQEQQVALQQCLETLQEELQRFDKEIEEKENTLPGLRRIAALSAQVTELRAALRADEPCKVCGSLDHPFGGQKVPPSEDLAKAEEAVERAERELESFRNARTEGLARKKGLEVQLEGEKQSGQELEKTLELRQAELQGALVGILGPQELLALENLKALPCGEIEQNLRAKKKEQEELLETLKDWEKALREKQEAQRELESKEAICKQQGDQLQGLQEEIQEMGAQIKAQEESFQNSLGDFQVSSLFEAREMARAFQEAAKKWEEARRELENCRKEKDNLVRRVPDVDQELEAAKEAFQKKQRERDDLLQKRAPLLDGAKPDKVEEDLKKRIASAAEEFEKVQEQWSVLEKKESEKKGLERDLVERIIKMTHQEEAENQELQKTMVEAKFFSLKELEEALLGEEELEKLIEAAQKLAEREVALQTSANLRAESLRAHEEKRSQFFADEEEVLLDILEVQAEEASTQLGDHREKVGSDKRALEQEEQNRTRYKELHKELSQAQKDFERWKVIDKLIGTDKGKAFMKAAQAMNLQKIVHHANRHLIRLRERFRLAVKRDDEGRPLLEFVIQDGHQGDRIREISTLSGGEGFLVSLALALGMADFRTLKMPVETLFLDEGFGTLDYEALREAVGVLSTLHSRENRQVGVISHVEALQEEIEARVLVEPLSGGRSRVRIERSAGIAALAPEAKKLQKAQSLLPNEM